MSRLQASDSVFIKGMKGPIDRNLIDIPRIELPARQPPSTVDEGLLAGIILVDDLEPVPP